jgi:tetratricopeptide (TPR) repeat protein
VVAIKAGYGFDFAPAVKDALLQATGRETAKSQVSSGKVATLRNDSQQAKVLRHLRAAAILRQKGRFAGAAKEVERAQAMAPNDVGVRTALAELYCLADRGQDALMALEGVVDGGSRVQARIAVLRGWAYRQSGQVEAALQNVEESLALNPADPRAHYELGRLYRAQGKLTEALSAYEKALALTLDRP